MKVIVLPPIAFINKFNISDMHLLLAHILQQNDEYFKKYKEVDGYKIVDNGAFEGKLMKFRDVVRLAEAVGAHEVQLPDYLFDFEKTFKEAQDALVRNDVRDKFRVHFVVQGSSKEELERGVQFAIDNDLVIGIPHEPCQMVYRRDFIPREPLLVWIEKEYGEEMLKNVHLLGCHDMFEFYSTYYQRCRSMDTTLPIKLGIHRITLPSLEDVKRPTDYFTINHLDGNQMDCILRNLRYIKSIVENEYDEHI